ncbi:MAG TPA: hypothetical protein VGO45_00105 [Bacteroidia bacterium]|jgi:hypothetical protein|nr:hypothetical protein [Bacteroidia bacterium]
METINEQLVRERKQHDGEEKAYISDEKRMTIPFGKISWAAIFSGVLVTTISQMLFSLLGMGIGMGAIDPLQAQDPMRGLATGTIIWWSVTMLISLFLGGLTTGQMYQTNSRTYLTWHGLLTWCTFALFSFFMLTTSVGMLISGTGNVIGTAVMANASARKNTPLDLSGITRSAVGLGGHPANTGSANGEIYNPNNTSSNSNNSGSTTSNSNNTGSVSSNSNNPGSVSSNSNNLNHTSSSNPNNSYPASSNSNNVSDLSQKTNGNSSYLVGEVQNFFQEDKTQTPESRRALVSTISNQTGMSETEANAQVDKWTASYEQMKADAKVRADQAARVVSIASIVGFFALLLGGLVTVWGARVGPSLKEYGVHH